MNKSKIDFQNDANKITASFGTPTYVVYEKILKNNYRQFYNSFKNCYKKIMVSYSVKTNYLPAILHILSSEGAAMEVVSGFELYLAMKAGVPPNKIVFNGPSKTLEELELAIKNDILLINVDSESELQKINNLGDKFGKKVTVGIRVNIKTLTWKKFGIPIEFAEDIIKAAAGLKNIEIKGLHIHIGTNISSPQPYVRALDQLINLIKKLHDIGLEIEFLDIGGGFPAREIGKWADKDRFIDAISRRLKLSKLKNLTKLIELFKSEKPVFPDIPPIETYAEQMCTKLKENLEKYNLQEPILILEPGRIIVNSTTTLLVRVIDIKQFEEKLVMVDGGINLVPSLAYEAHHIKNITGKGTNLEVVKLSGPLCIETDILSQRAEILPVHEGDIIEIFDVGAYSLCQSIQFIKPRGSVVLVRENGTCVEVRRRESYEDLVNLDMIQVSRE